jgi:predicted amidohydrolase
VLGGRSRVVQLAVVEPRVDRGVRDPVLGQQGPAARGLAREHERRARGRPGWVGSGRRGDPGVVLGVRAHLVQFDIAWEDREANFRAVDRLLSGVDVAPGDLVLLPELFDSGFSLNTDVTADRDGETAAYLAGLADDMDCVVQGGRTVRSCVADSCRLARNHATVFGAGGKLLARVREDPSVYVRAGARARFEGGDGVVTYGVGRADGVPGGVLRPAVPGVVPARAHAGAEVFCLGANWPEAQARRTGGRSRWRGRSRTRRSCSR